MANYEELRQRHVASAAAMAPEMLGRIDWSVERLTTHRRLELQRLVRVARDLSPWHRRRLAGVDPEAIDEAALSELPVMTKDDLMANFDAIVTDDRLRLDVVEAHLEALTSDAYLFDRYHACASGGSSGRRGVFVYDWDGWAVAYWSYMRYLVRALRQDPQLADVPMVVAAIAAENSTHGSRSMSQTFSNPKLEMHRFPVTRPMEEIVAGLNAVHPTLLLGYPSTLYGLVHEARAGRLDIHPLRVMSGGEPLLPEIRIALQDMWEAPVDNLWGASEGPSAVGCGSGAWLHLSDDLAIVEPVDAAGRPVAPGVRSDKIFITNLFNHALPLIRYEITDQIRLIDGPPCPCGSVHQRIDDPSGRLDDCFSYGGVTVHPHVFRSPLGRNRNIVEYQVRQTPIGAEVAARCIGPIDLPALEGEIASSLARLGLPAPEVVVTPVNRIERQSSGKLKRFVALAATPLQHAPVSP